MGGTTADLSGWSFRDNDPARVTAPAIIPAGTILPPGGYYVLNEVVKGVGQFNFGLGGADSADHDRRERRALDSYSWTAHATITYGRCPNGTGAYVNTASSTKGAANDCPAGGTGGGGLARRRDDGRRGHDRRGGHDGHGGYDGRRERTGSGGGGAGGGAGMATLRVADRPTWSSPSTS